VFILCSEGQGGVGYHLIRIGHDLGPVPASLQRAVMAVGAWN
jgi:hypothetical protein